MLVITRITDEEFLIGDNIIVKIVRAGGRVQLGISAPTGLPVTRTESLEKLPDGQEILEAVRRRIVDGSQQPRQALTVTGLIPFPEADRQLGRPG